MRGSQQESTSYGALYRWLTAQLPHALEVRELFTLSTGKPTGALAQLREEPVPLAVLQKAQALVAARRAGEPLQYLLGEWDFYGMTLAVGAGVLIPRADTEVLVDTVLKKLTDYPVATPHILDLCAGSGAIALALAAHSTAEVCAVEYSAEAFAYLVRNIQRTQSRVTAIQGDVREYLPDKPVDIIVSNPPYIPRGELDGLAPEVQREPRLALDGGEDGLDFYRLLTKRYAPYVKPGGYFCYEVGIRQSKAVAALLEAEGFAEIGQALDYGGIPRVVWGKK